MSIEADTPSIESIVTKIIRSEIKKHVDLRWTTPPLHNLCSDLCWKIKREIIEYYPLFTVEVVSGEWVGEKRQEHANLRPHDIATGHNWLKVVGDGITTQLDPTYVQFLNVEWSYDGCKGAIVYCEHNSLGL